MKIKTSTYNQLQTLCWTEDNRLQAVKDDKTGSYYNYDATGERNLKLTGGTLNVTQNGMQVNAPVFDQQTLYASALVTVNDKGYTKHYFEEGKRICSKIGSGELQKINDLVPYMGEDYSEQREIQTNGIYHTYDQCIHLFPYIQNKSLYDRVIKYYEYQVNPTEPIFYYHSDHLGSASYITEKSGTETQHIVYLPFGEDWVDIKYNTQQFDTPYKFNGKEKDEETGYNYYGARYYTDKLSIFLSVDPMSDKYPHLSSYAYCTNNPIMLIDPDGRDIDEASQTEHIKNMRDKNHKDYNQMFAEKCEELDADHTSLYRFNKVEEKKEREREIYGSLTYGGSENGMDVVNINYTDGDYKESGLLSTPKDFVLFEETAHAGQFLDRKLGFAFSGLTNKWEGSLGLDLTDEVDAKNFAAKALGMKHKFTINNIQGDYNDKLSKTPLSAKSHHEKLVNSPIQYNSKGLPENPYFKYRQPK